MIKVFWALVIFWAGVAAILFMLVTGGCALAPVKDVPCEFHKKNPNSSVLLLVLWEMCERGDSRACNAYREIGQQLGEVE